MAIQISKKVFSKVNTDTQETSPVRSKQTNIFSKVNTNNKHLQECQHKQQITPARSTKTANNSSKV